MNELFEPFPNILSRKIEDEFTKKELASYAEAIDKLVSIGTHLLKWELKGELITPISLDESITVSSYFKRMLELLDSIARLIEIGAVSTSVVLLRTLLETDLSFEFLLKGDIKRKCYCIIVADLFKEINDLKNPMISEIVPDVDLHRNELQRQIDLSMLSQVKTQYMHQNVNPTNGELKNKNFKWYNMFTRFNTLDKLAKELGRYKQYKVVYQVVGSSFIHSADLLKDNLIYEDGVPAIVQMRNPTDALEVTRMAFDISRKACSAFSKRMADTYRQDYIWALQVCVKQHQIVTIPTLFRG